MLSLMASEVSEPGAVAAPCCRPTQLGVRDSVDWCCHALQGQSVPSCMHVMHVMHVMRMMHMMHVMHVMHM